MGVPSDPIVSGGDASQHINGVAIGIDARKAIIRSVEWSRRAICLNAKSEEDNAVRIGRKRCVDENGAIEAVGPASIGAITG